MLAIDTTGKVSGTAIADENALLAELTVTGPLTHSETLQGHIAKVLNLAGKNKNDITAIAVSLGPGSFTGLRIGLATAKAMAYALAVPLVGVSTMHALAAHFYCAAEDILVVIDAQKKNVYRELLHWGQGELVTLQKTAVLPLAEVLSECEQSGRPTIILGDGLKQTKLSSAPMPNLPPNVRLAPPHLRIPRAANVAWLGLKKLAQGDLADPMTLEPTYLRRSEAEILWERQHG